MRKVHVSSLCRAHWLVVAAAMVLTVSGESLAWTPPAQTKLTDLAQARLDALSFFSFGWLLCAAGFRLLWNAIAHERPGWRRLTYRRALAGSLAGSFLIIAVLSAVAGAWKFLWPRTWRESEATRQLTAAVALEDSERLPPDPPSTMPGRIVRLAALRDPLWSAARDGLFPASRQESGIPDDQWQQARFPSVDYIYRPGLRLGGPPEPLVIEYHLSGDGQLALHTDGTVKLLPAAIDVNPVRTDETAPPRPEASQ